MAQLNWQSSYDATALRWGLSYEEEGAPAALVAELVATGAVSGALRNLATPVGTVTIGAITPTSTGASIAFTYSDDDETGFEYRIDAGTAQAAGASSPLVIADLAASTEYDIEIRAINADGEGAWSSASTFETRMANAGERATIVRKIEISSTVPPAVTPLRAGGTVHSLVSDFTGTGFQLLTTCPGTPVYRSSGHTGGVWDSERRIMWFFGAETHNIADQFDNAIYGWRADDGLIIKHYDQDPITEYRMDAGGILWSTAEKVRPWAAHTFRTLRYIPETSEIEVVSDLLDHAFMNPPIFEDPSMGSGDRVAPMWYYSVVTGQWRYTLEGDTSTFILPQNSGQPIGWHPTYGWFRTNGAQWYRLSPERVRSTDFDPWNKTNGAHHSYWHVHGDVAYKVGGSGPVYFYSRHPLLDLDSSQRFATADYAALSDYTGGNDASVLMPDGRILFFPVINNEYRALILDPEADTLVDTGHRLGPTVNTNYEFITTWSAVHNCAIMLLHRFSPNRVYAYRPE